MRGRKGSTNHLIEEKGVCPIRPSTNTVDSEALDVSWKMISMVNNPFGGTAARKVKISLRDLLQVSFKQESTIVDQCGLVDFANDLEKIGLDPSPVFFCIDGILLQKRLYRSENSSSKLKAILQHQADHICNRAIHHYGVAAVIASWFKQGDSGAHLARPHAKTTDG